jgi:riboflavin kinase/FMN adenylyltransferase
MIIHHGYNNLKINSPVVTMGIFDGVHRGHATLLNYLVRRAGDFYGESVVITFHPHPRLILDKNKEGLSFLSSMEEKVELLRKANVDHLVIIEFTRAFSRMKACDFVENILGNKIGTKHLVIGYDHHFGYKGEGNIKTINECSGSMGFEVEQVQGLRTLEGTISSSLIRNSLLRGDIEGAAKMLGYNYSVMGKVIGGKKIGRKIGFPTANIEPEYHYKLVPGDGVYAVEVHTGGITKPGMLSIGQNPTVNKTTGKRTIEVNILNFEADIYGKDIEVVFRYRLRDEKKFGSLDQLKKQMEKDKADTLQLLA